MKSTNNEVDKVPTGHLLTPNEASNKRTVLHLIELLAKGALQESPNNPPVIKTLACFPQTDINDPVLKIIPTQLIKDRDSNLVST